MFPMRSLLDAVAVSLWNCVDGAEHDDTFEIHALFFVVFQSRFGQQTILSDQSSV